MRDGRAPLNALAEFLASLGVIQPARAAGRLLREFGSISSVVAGRRARLSRIVGSSSARAIAASRRLMLSSLAEQMKEGAELRGRADVVRFLRMQLGGLRQERLIALYLDSRLRLLRCEKIAEGSVDAVTVDVSRIVHIALDVGASGIVLAHNHPSGDPKPSRSDIMITRRLGRIAADLDLRLIDHIIVTRDGAWSVMHHEPEGPSLPASTCASQASNASASSSS